MTTLRTIIVILLITPIFSCKNASSNRTESEQKEGIVNDSIKFSQQLNNSLRFSKDEENADSITIINFNELTISIDRLNIFDRERKISQLDEDTTILYARLGETIEGQLISILSDQLTGLKIEQRYESSVTIRMKDHIATSQTGNIFIQTGRY